MSISKSRHDFHVLGTLCTRDIQVKETISLQWQGYSFWWVWKVKIFIKRRRKTWKKCSRKLRRKKTWEGREKEGKRWPHKEISRGAAHEGWRNNVKMQYFNSGVRPRIWSKKTSLVSIFTASTSGASQTERICVCAASVHVRKMKTCTWG